ncbi:hypothetical protein D3C87_931540 [compost metagenome]
MQQQYIVYTNEPHLLAEYGEVYVPKIKMSFVVLTTDMDLLGVCNLPGVYEARECEKGRLCI